MRDAGWCRQVAATTKIEEPFCHISIYGVVLNSFFSKRPFLAKNKNYFSQTFAILTKKLSRGPMLDCIWEFLVGNGTWQGTSPRLSGHQNSSLAAAHSHVMFCFSRWSFLTFSGQFWHCHTETKSSPASCLPGNKTEHQQFRPPSFQEKAVFRQALSKLSPNFRRKIALHKPHLQKSMYVPVISYSFAKLSPRNNLL